MMIKLLNVSRILRTIIRSETAGMAHCSVKSGVPQGVQVHRKRQLQLQVSEIVTKPWKLKSSNLVTRDSSLSIGKRKSNGGSQKSKGS